MKRILSLLALLGLCVSLSACGGEPQLPEAEGVAREETLLTVDGREVTAGQYLYWLNAICCALEEQYQAAGKTLDWSAPVEEGTLGDYVKNQALRSAALYATVETWAETYGCVLTEEDRSAMESQWADKAASLGGEEAYLNLLAQKGLDRAGAERMAEDHYLYVQLCALAETANTSLYAAEADLAAFFAERGCLTVQVLRFSGEDAQRQAEEVFAQLNRSDDPAAEFDALGASEPQTIVPGDGTLPEELSAAAAALAPGQVSGILESGGGYAILLRREDDLSAVRLAHFDHRLQSAADGADIQTAESYVALDVSAFWEEILQTRAVGD